MKELTTHQIEAMICEEFQVSVNLAFVEIEETHSQRSAGREALKRVCTLQSEQPVFINEIQFPHSRFSISHTRDLAVAVGLVPFSHFRSLPIYGVGVDLERFRPLKRRISKFFLCREEQEWLESLHLEDQAHQEELLRFWCIKEALFKSNLENTKTHLKQYQLKTPSLASGQASFKGDLRDRERSYYYFYRRSKSYHFAFAFSV